MPNATDSSGNTPSPDTAIGGGRLMALPRTPERSPGNLPLGLTSFVGREREVAEVEKLLAERRLLTLRAGYLALAQGDHIVARSRLQESVEVWRELGGRQAGLAHALWILGLEMLAGGEPARARLLTEESVGIFRTIGDEVGLAHSLANLGAIVLSQSDYALSKDLARTRPEQDRRSTTEPAG